MNKHAGKDESALCSKIFTRPSFASASLRNAIEFILEKSAELDDQWLSPYHWIISLQMPYRMSSNSRLEGNRRKQSSRGHIKIYSNHRPKRISLRLKVIYLEIDVRQGTTQRCAEESSSTVTSNSNFACLVTSYVTERSSIVQTTLEHLEPNSLLCSRIYCVTSRASSSQTGNLYSGPSRYSTEIQMDFVALNTSQGGNMGWNRLLTLRSYWRESDVSCGCPLPNLHHERRQLVCRSWPRSAYRWSQVSPDHPMGGRPVSPGVLLRDPWMSQSVPHLLSHIWD